MGMSDNMLACIRAIAEYRMQNSMQYAAALRTAQRKMKVRFNTTRNCLKTVQIMLWKCL